MVEQTRSHMSSDHKTNSTSFLSFSRCFLCVTSVCRPDMAAPREFIPTSGTTANWKTEHDAMYTPIEFDARWVLNGSSIIPFVLVHTYYAIVRLTQSLSLSLSPINRNLSVSYSSSDPIWLFRENLFLHRVLRPTGRQNMMQCILRLSSTQGNDLRKFICLSIFIFVFMPSHVIQPKVWCVSSM